MWPEQVRRWADIIFHEGIPCKPLKIRLFDLNVEIIGFEFHQKGTYKPPVVDDLEFTNELIKIRNHFPSKYDNLIMIDDLNMIIENVHLNTLLQLFNLNALINSSTCYQSHIPSTLHWSHFNKSKVFV